MTTLSALLSLVLGLSGVALAADPEFDWGDPDEEYDSPFADDTDDSFDEDDKPEQPDENPFASELETDDADDESSAPGADAATDQETDAPEANEDEEVETKPLTTIAEARSLCDTSMRVLHEGHSEEAFEQLAPHWAFSADEMAQLQGEVDRTRAVVADQYGDALDYRLVREDTVDDVLARFVYLERFERHGLRWQFTFYKGGEGWTLNDASFDDKIEILLDG